MPTSEQLYQAKQRLRDIAATDWASSQILVYIDQLETELQAARTTGWNPADPVLIHEVPGKLSFRPVFTTFELRLYIGTVAVCMGFKDEERKTISLVISKANALSPDKLHEIDATLPVDVIACEVVKLLGFTHNQDVHAPLCRMVQKELEYLYAPFK